MLQSLLIKAALVAAVGSVGLATASFTSGHNSPEMLSVAQSKFSIKGTAVDPDGNSAEKIPVYLKQLALAGMGAGGGGEEGFSTGPNDKLDLAQEGKRGADRWKEISKTLTDANGAFTLKNVEKGSYRVQVGDPERTAWEYKSVTMDDKDIDLGEIKLRPRIERRTNRGSGGQGGGDQGGGGR